MNTRGRDEKLMTEQNKLLFHAHNNSPTYNWYYMYKNALRMFTKMVRLSKMKII